MKHLITVMLVFFSAITYSQSSVKSQIISANEKDPLCYAHVFNRNTHVNTLSDSEGWFNIQCNFADTIVVRCLGYKTLTILASDATRTGAIELMEDPITLKEIVVSPQNAYRLLLQAMDSTNAHQLKSFQGKCYRQDKLSFIDKAERKCEAEILFDMKGIKHGDADVDCWLNDFKSEISEKEKDQPRVQFSNEIPLYPLKIPKGKITCTIVLDTDSILVIHAKMAKPSGQFTNENNYFINKETWLIKGIEYKGNFKIKPLKKGYYHFFQTDARLTFDVVGDSCVLRMYSGKFIFSHKKVDPQNVWEYAVNMDIVTAQNIIQKVDDKKLRPLDFLLYKTKTQKK